MPVNNDGCVPSTTVFDEWLHQCLNQQHNKQQLSVLYENLRTNANEFFVSFASNSKQNQPQNEHDTLSQTLALLISKLTPIFSDHTKNALKQKSSSHENSSITITTSSAIVAGLYLICGALEGIHNNNSIHPMMDPMETTQKNQIGLTHSIQNLIGNFLLEQCYLDHPQDVKDIAILSLHALVQTSNVDLYPSNNPSPEEHKIPDWNEARIKSQIWRLNLAREAIMRITGTTPLQSHSNNPFKKEENHADETSSDTETNQDYDDDDEDDDKFDNNNIIGDISEFPRLKRTSCFQILVNALKGFQLDTADGAFSSSSTSLHHSIEDGEITTPPPPPPSPNTNTTTPNKDVDIDNTNNSNNSKANKSHHSLFPLFLTSMSEFISLSAQCLHGESDPRCLIILLKLLRSCQELFLPFFSHFDTATFVMEDTKKSIPFPYIEVFDAAAPYYPIQFTPPPNIPNAVTREELHNSLMSVLVSYPPIQAYSTYRNEGNDNAKNDDENDKNMIALTCSLFLERLSPDQDNIMDDDHADYGSNFDVHHTTKDKLEVMTDLNLLLKSPPCYVITTTTTNNNNNNNNNNSQRNRTNMKYEYKKLTPIHLLNRATLIEFSEALLHTHSEASKADTSDPTSFTPSDEKILASQCRELTVYILSQLEEEQRLDKRKSSTHKKKSLSSSSTKWNIFLINIIKSICSHMTSAPESLRGRIAAAFLSSMASAGPETLRSCYRSCLPPLFGAFESSLENNDMERITAICYTLAGFFGATTQLETRRKEHHGRKDAMTAMAVVVLHPHPLLPYGVKALQMLYGLLITMNIICDSADHANDNDNSYEKRSLKDGNDMDTENITSTGTSYEAGASVVYALEALLFASPIHIMKSNELEMNNEIKTLLLSLTENICINDQYNENENTNAIQKWNEMCAHAIGSLIGMFPSVRENEVKMSQSDDSNSATDDSCLQFFAGWSYTVIVPRLIESAIKIGVKGIIPKNKRFDWSALARGCALNEKLSSTVIISIITSLIRGLYKTMNETMVNEDDLSIVNMAMALSFVTQNGGDHTKLAWQSAAIELPDLFQSSGKKVHGGFYLLIAMCGFKDGLNETVFHGDLDDAVMGKLILPGKDEAVRNDIDRLVKLSSSITPQLLSCYENSPASLIKSIIQFVSPVLPPLSMFDIAKVTITLPILSAAMQSTQSFDLIMDSSVKETTFDELKQMIPSLCDFILSQDNDPIVRSTAATIVYSTLFHFPDSAKLVSSVLSHSIFPPLVDAANQLDGNLKDVNLDQSLACFEDTLNLAALVGAAAACRGGIQAASTADNVIKFLINLICTGKTILPFTNVEIIVPYQFLKHISLSAGQAFGSMLSIDNGGPFWKQRACFVALPSLLEGCKNDEKNKVSPFSLGTHLVIAHMICCVSLKAFSNDRIKNLIEVIIHKFISINNCNAEEDVFVDTTLGAFVKLLSLVPKLVTRHALVLIPAFLNVCGNDRASPSTISMALHCISTMITFADVKQMLNKDVKREVLEKLSFLLDHNSRGVRQAAVTVRNQWFLL